MPLLRLRFRWFTSAERTTRGSATECSSQCMVLGGGAGRGSTSRNALSCSRVIGVLVCLVAPKSVGAVRVSEDTICPLRKTMPHGTQQIKYAAAKSPRTAHSKRESAGTSPPVPLARPRLGCSERRVLKALHWLTAILIRSSQALAPALPRLSVVSFGVPIRSTLRSSTQTTWTVCMMLRP